MKLDVFFKTVRDFKEVSQLILISNEEQILYQHMEHSKIMANMIFQSARQCHAIGKDRLSYLLFSRKNKKNLFIFPIANYYLGVIKNKDANDIVLATNILGQINTIEF